MNVEVARRRIDLAAIAAAYDYSPFPEEYVPPEKIDFGIDWEASRKTINAAVSTIASNFDSIVPENGEQVICTADLSPSGYLEFKKVFFPGDNEAVLMLNLKDSNDQEVGAFDFQQSINGWNISHRKVQAAYAGQGIASEMLAVLEQFAADYGNHKQRNQRCMFDSSQLDVTDFFLGKGYEPEDEELFYGALDDLERGNRRFMLKSRPFREKTLGSPECWYVFKQTSDESNLWEEGVNKDKSVSFRFYKEIKVTTVTDLSEDTVAAVNNTVAGGKASDNL